jgi:membrane protease YdiL (CAAX protease family)
MKQAFAFPLTRLVLIILGFVVLASVILRPLAMKPGAALLGQTLAFLLLLAVTLIVERLCANQTLSDIGFSGRGAITGTLGGLLLGGVLFSIVIGILALTHAYTAHLASWRGLGTALILFLIVALFEELLFRGVIFRLIEQTTGTWIALALSAALFGLLHIANPGATIFSSIAIALEAGVLLALAYVLTRSLWFAIGIHWGWNLFEGPIFGTQVSGTQFTATVLHANMHGQSWLTGGKFGPEAGVVAIIVCVAAAIIVGAAAIRKQRLVQPLWDRLRVKTPSNP